MEKQILLNVDYGDNTDKFYYNSCIKNKIFTLDPKNIHKEIANILYDNDFMTILYKGKPTTNVYIDTKKGENKKVGYIYRVKTEIEGKKASFDAWVTIKEIIDFPIKEINQ